jgi:hypothetical protein
VKKGKTWLIPEEAEKPADKRKMWEKRMLTCIASVIEDILAANINWLIG